MDPSKEEPLLEPLPLDPDPRAPDAPSHPALRFIQLLADPRGLYTLMGAGGGLLVLGVVLWLVAIGLFEEPLYAALAMGAGNFALLGGGVLVVDRTRYRLAGRSTAMLACLLLPLNLWFYHAQGLITLDGGGHLWAPALVCCLVYAGVARRLKDAWFVYTFAGGVALAGMLLLADSRVDHFWEILAPSALLVALGVGCIHAERVFPEAD